MSYRILGNYGVHLKAEPLDTTCAAICLTVNNGTILAEILNELI